MKYLVMECRAAYAVVLGDDGTFRKVANLRYEVGQTLTDVVPLQLPEVTEAPTTNNPTRRWISSLAAMAACLVLTVTGIFYTGQRPCASVYMTINPEVRIDVNHRDMVVEVEGVNSDGDDLLTGYSHQKKDLDTVMDELVDRAIDMGYLHEGGTITLSLDGSDTWVNSHEGHLNRHLSDHLTDKISVTVDVTPRQPEPAKPTLPDKPIVIPVTPGSSDSDYDDSDYGPAAETTAPVPLPPVSGEDGMTDYSDYADDSGYSDYEAAASDYEDAASDYEDAASDYEDSSDAASDYEDAASDYEDAASDYEDSSDAASDYEDAASDYDSGDDDDSGYEEDDADSGYDDSDYEDS